MENKNNISKLTKILFVALAMGMILISPYQLCNVAAADKYYGYQKKTKSVKTKITASKKKVRIKKKYRSAAGEYQEIEGPPIARAMLMALEFSPALINRVCDMVAHHHSYDKIDDVDLQILIEADFMVNAYEEGLPKRNIKSFRDKIFRTETGIHYLNELFALEN